MNGFVYTEEHNAFLLENAGRIACLTDRFNKRFNCAQSRSAIRCRLNRLGKTSGYRFFDSNKQEYLRGLLSGHSYTEATRLFNEKYGTSFSVKKIQDHCVRTGLKRNIAEKNNAVNEYIKKNYSRNYKDIAEELGMNPTSISNRAKRMGLPKKHRAWNPGTDRRKLMIKGMEVQVSNAVYVRFIGNRFHRISEELKPTALEIVKLQADISRQEQILRKRRRTDENQL